ncbi:MAG: AMP-binding protein [Rhodobacterales bacterium]|nr:AMP-binding protein [Rhodobacterales bacterium]
MDILRALERGAQDAARQFMAVPGGLSFTYRRTLDRAGQYAGALTALGLVRGDRLACQGSKSAEFICLYLGCLRAGIVFLPLNPAYTTSETAYFLSNSEAAVHLCDPGNVAAMTGIAEGTRTMSMEDMAHRADIAEPDFSDVESVGSDLAAVLYTSGTTGRSKGVMLSRENLGSNAETLADAWRFTESDVLLHALPVFHTHGLFVATNTVIMAGASMIFLPAFHPDAVFAALPQTTVMMGVPTFYARMLNDPRLDMEVVAHMRLFVSGSAPLSAITHREWSSATGHAILERYGMTETNMNTSNPYVGERRAGTVGMALPGIDVRVCDPATGANLAKGAVGSIEVRGPNVFDGYWRAPEKTASEFRSTGFFITGDIGAYDADGYLRIVGRSKDLVISGGLNVYPVEVEDVLDDLEGVAASAIIGVPHPDFGEAVVAIVVPRPGADLTEDRLKGQMRERLATFKLPKRIILADDLPRNAMGKVQKNVLREKWKSLFTASS